MMKLTNEQKNELIEDLIGRLSYEVKVEITWEDDAGLHSHDETLSLDEKSIKLINAFKDGNLMIRPYLVNLYDWTDDMKRKYREETQTNFVPSLCKRGMKFFNENHIDYRGFIEQNIAHEIKLIKHGIF